MDNPNLYDCVSRKIAGCFFSDAIKIHREYETDSESLKKNKIDLIRYTSNVCKLYASVFGIDQFRLFCSHVEKSHTLLEDMITVPPFFYLPIRKRSLSNPHIILLSHLYILKCLAGCDGVLKVLREDVVTDQSAEAFRNYMDS